MPRLPDAGAARRRSVLGTPAARTRASTLALASLLLAAVACDDGAPEQEAPAASDQVQALLLEAADLPARSSGGRDVESLPPAPYCATLSSAEGAPLRRSDVEVAARELTLEGGGSPVVVESGVFVWDRTSSADGLVEQVRTFAGDCAALPEDARLGQGDVTAVFREQPGLPEGAAGYALTLEDATGPTEQAARAYAAVGRSVVVVGARTDGTTPLPDLAALLQVAVERASAQGEPA